MTTVQQAKSAYPQPLSWLRTRRLVVGGFPHQPEHWQNLSELGVCSVLSCCDPSEGSWDPPSHWAQGRVTLADHRNPEEMTASMLDEAINTGVALYANSPALYIHCWAGMERSPLVAIGLLCRAEGLSFFDALNQVRLHHRQARPITSHLILLERLLDSAA